MRTRSKKTLPAEFQRDVLIPCEGGCNRATPHARRPERAVYPNAFDAPADQPLSPIGWSQIYRCEICDQSRRYGYTLCPLDAGDGAATDTDSDALWSGQ